LSSEVKLRSITGSTKATMAKGKRGISGILLFSLLGAGLYVFNKGAKTKELIDKLKYEVVGFAPNWKRIDFRNFTLPGTLNVRFINPTNTEATFSNFFGSLEYQGVQMGSATAPQAQRVGASGNTTIGFPTEVRLDKIALALKANFLTLVATKKLPQMNLKGSFNSMGVNIPIDAVI